MKLRIDAVDKHGCIAFWGMMKKKKIKPTVTTFTQLLFLARKIRDKEWYEEIKGEWENSGIEKSAAISQLLTPPEDKKFWKN